MLVPESISVGVTTVGYYNTDFTITDFQLLISLSDALSSLNTVCFYPLLISLITGLNRC